MPSVDGRVYQTVDPNDIQRFAPPTDWDDGEPIAGSCWNCSHVAQVRIDGKWYDLCAKERDASASGDLEVADSSIHDCEDWDDYSA